MNMIFMKEPYGIVCEENKIHLYNYEKQETVKTFILENKVPQDFCIRLAIGQIIDLDKLLEEMDFQEKKIFLKLMEDCSKCFRQTDCVTQEDISKEILKYECEKIGDNYANSIPCNAKYKVYKKLNENIKKTAVVIFGAGLIGSELIAHLSIFPWAELYLIDEEEVSQRKILKRYFYQEVQVEMDWTEVLRKKNPNLRILKNLNELEKLQKTYSYLHVIYTSENPNPKKIRQINMYMEEKKIVWSLLTADSKSLIIGPTLYPGNSGCLACNFEIEKLQNKYNLMPYEVNLITGMFISDICKIVGDMEEFIVEDIAVTIGRAFLIDRRTMEGKSRDMERHLECSICALSKSNYLGIKNSQL